MMEWLAEKGHECCVITSYPYYPQWEVQAPYTRKRFWYLKETVILTPTSIPIKVYRCPMFVPKNPTGLKRVLSDFTFFCSALLLLFTFSFKKKKSIVISVAPTFLAGVLGAFYKKIKGAKHIHHIQDLQIEAATKLGLITSKTLINTLFKIEDYIFNNSDIVSSISPSMIVQIEKKCHKKVMFFPNWTDNSLFYPIENRLDLKSKFGFCKEDTVLVYSGAIGEKQGLEIILVAAKELQKNDKLKFLICGSGPYQLVLQKKAHKMGLNNITFLPLQPKAIFNEFLNMADVHLVIQKADASNLVMPSKLTTILSVGGVALITANKNSDLYKLIDTHKMGLLVNAEDASALTKGIEYLINNGTISLSKNAYTYAKRYLSQERIMEEFESEICT